MLLQIFCILLFIIQSDALISTWYKSDVVDDSAVVSEVLPQSFSLVECAAYCSVQNSCTVVEYDKATQACNSLDRGSITWTNPTRSVYINGNNPSKLIFKFFSKLQSDEGLVTVLLDIVSFINRPRCI